MKRLTLLLMKLALKRAKKQREKAYSTIVRHAYDRLIESYETTIMFLKSEINS